MDKEIFKHTYCELCDLVQNNSSVFQSKALKDIISNSSTEERIKKMEDFLRIQLESETLKNDIHTINQDNPTWNAYDKQKLLLKNKINNFLLPFSSTEQNAILFNMIHNARRISGKSMDTLSEMQLSQKDRAFLENELIEEISGISKKMMEDVANLQKESYEDSDIEEQNPKFSNEAVAGAAYACSSMLRNNPCFCGVFVGGTELIHESTKHSENIEFIGNVMIGIAGILVFFLTVLMLGNIGADYFGENITAGISPITADSFLKETILPFFQEFGIVIAVTVGTGLTGILLSLFASSPDNIQHNKTDTSNEAVINKQQSSDISLQYDSYEQAEKEVQSRI